MIIILFGLLTLQWIGADGQCRFPSEWRGTWYQSGLGQVEISQHYFSKKGICLENHRDYFLLENREGKCLQCLLIMYQHTNILQYKESYCIGGQSLNSICQQIRVEAILYTLVREPALPIPCPFTDTFNLLYNNNSGGFCTEPASNVKSCASDAKFRFHFKQCPNAAYTHNRVVDLECLASWKHGSDMYLYGGLSANGLVDKDDIYRCFMYRVFGTLVYLAMSADATCRGLISSSDGPLVMELTKDTGGWPESRCEFPSWFRRNTWRDLSAKHVYDVDDSGSRMTVTYRRHQGYGHVRHSVTCISGQMEGNMEQEEFIGVSYVLDDCESRYQCIRIVRRHKDVIEFYRGQFVNKDSLRCEYLQFRDSIKQVLIPADIRTTQCPYRGRFFINPHPVDCEIDIRSGCNTSSLISIVSSCIPQPVWQLECLITWQEGHKHYVIARRPRDRRPAANCFSFREKNGILEFGTDADCNSEVSYIFNNPVSYTLNPFPAPCEKEVKKVTREREDDDFNNKDSRDVDKGTYRHAPNDDPNHVFHDSQSDLRSSASLLLLCPLTLIFTVAVHYR